MKTWAATNHMREEDELFRKIIKPNKQKAFYG